MVILHTRGAYCVAQEASAYVIYRLGAAGRERDSAFAVTPSGRSIAVARCDYLAAR